MPSDKLSTAMAAIVDYIGTNMGIDTAEHPGEFTENDLKKAVQKKRAIRLSVELIPNIKSSPQGIATADMQIAAVVICAVPGTKDRHRAVLNMVEELTGLIHLTRFNTNYCHPVKPETISATNLFSGTLESRALSMWGVGFTVKIQPTGD